MLCCVLRTHARLEGRTPEEIITELLRRGKLLIFDEPVDADPRVQAIISLGMFDGPPDLAEQAAADPFEGLGG